MQLMMNSSNKTYKMVAYGAVSVSIILTYSNYNNLKKSGKRISKNCCIQHDTTIVPLLRIFDVKERLLGTGNPDFTSMVTLELWKKSDGSYVVKVV